MLQIPQLLRPYSMYGRNVFASLSTLSIPNAKEQTAKPPTAIEKTETSPKTKTTKWFHITLMRGFIGLENRKRTSAKSLGLYRRGQTVLVRADNPTTLGYILSIKELVRMRMEEHPSNHHPSLPSRKTPLGFHKFSSYIA